MGNGKLKHRPQIGEMDEMKGRVESESESDGDRTSWGGKSDHVSRQKSRKRFSGQKSREDESLVERERSLTYCSASRL